LTDLKRGTVVTVAAGGGIGHKPRPAIVVQHDDYANSDTLIVVPLTGEVRSGLLTRPVFQPDESNGLLEPSRLMTNRIAGAPIANVGKIIGTMSREDMERVDAALSLVLGLGAG
jgi:mRNA interferase MazF